jgi:hypothetical protein
MKASIGTGAIALALLLSGCGGESENKAGNSTAPAGTASAPVTPPEGGDWTQVVVETPEGGFRMGNPNAAVKLVEYASVTCPHCAEFSEQASETIKNDYVKNGQVSWEFRHLLLPFPTDPGMSLLARCQGPGRSPRFSGSSHWRPSNRWSRSSRPRESISSSGCAGCPRPRSINASTTEWRSRS